MDLKDIDTASALGVGLTLVAELAAHVAADATLLGQLPSWVVLLIFAGGAAIRSVLKQRALAKAPEPGATEPSSD